MKHGITFSKSWADDDMVAFRVDVFDGQNSFTNEVYVGHEQLKNTVSDLGIFKEQIYGGIYDLNFGAFGPEYASGALHVRLHFQERGIIHASVEMQTDYRQFGKKFIASEAKLYLCSEPALLDNFIAKLNQLSNGQTDDALLAGV